MKVFMRPQTYRVISFDLDDTLYDNRPVIAQAEAASLCFLQQHYPKTKQWQASDWQQLKATLLTQFPALNHDVSLARQVMLARGLTLLGYSESVAHAGAKTVFEHFSMHRSCFRVSQSVLELLQHLKQHYRLIGITNGNVDHQKIGLAELLEFVLHPGQHVKQKPAADMFEQAAKRLEVPLTQILHVGDSASSDVEGARRAGCQSVWLNPSFDGCITGNAKNSLPHIEIQSIFQLEQLILPH